jgi:hypothetical protein
MAAEHTADVLPDLEVDLAAMPHLLGRLACTEPGTVSCNADYTRADLMF